MRFSALLGFGCLSFASAWVTNSTHPTLIDSATTGYAIKNGGTSGGRGGNVTAVYSLEQLTAAVSGDKALIVVVARSMSGSGTIKVGSNKSIIGKDPSIGRLSKKEVY
jgi:pectate lyase